MSSSIDSVLDESKYNMEVEGIKNGYHCPYIIPLSSYHKVETDGTNRISLRFMGNSSKYTYADICKMYDEGELLKWIVMYKSFFFMEFEWALEFSQLGTGVGSGMGSGWALIGNWNGV